MDTVREVGPLTVAWRGCVLHRIHLPKPSRTHQHHVFPLFLQKRLWGEVRVQSKVDVCPTGHDDVHAGLDALLAGRQVPKGVGRREKTMAQQALSAYMQSKEALLS